MPDLLFELLSEEIPARMQRRAADDLRKAVTGALVEEGITYEGAYASATPRRLVLHLAGVAAASPDRTEERKGPRVGAPDKAVEGFLKAAGLSTIAEADVVADPKKGDYYLARTKIPGRPTTEVLAEVLPRIVRGFPWPKSMRWGAASAEPGSLRWVRPLTSVLATFGPETEEPEIVSFPLDGVPVGDTTLGHRFLSDGPIRVRRMEDYAAKLFDAKVMVDIDRRRDVILHDARDRAFALGLSLVEDEALLEEVAGLVEWPVVLVGRFDEAFLALPDEVIRLTIRENQKCFVLADPETGRLADAFVLTANIEAPDGGAAIVAGNERVVRARLSDARFFWETDLARPLEAHGERLAAVTFHEKLGSQADRVARIERLARALAPAVGADADAAARAARLSKADLVTGMVGEFPELQGYVGRHYAEAAGEAAEVAAAVEDHYRPLGPSDAVPDAPVSVAVALADKIDTLVGFFSIDEKPTGSKDPYALRRAALGVIRIVVGNRLSLPLAGRGGAAGPLSLAREGYGPLAADPSVEADLVAFLIDRLKVQLRQDGARHDLVDAVLALGGEDDLLLVVERVEALGRFLGTEDGENLLQGYRRAVNILRAEEKKEARTFEGPVDRAALAEPAEAALADAVEGVREAVRAAVAREDFEAALAALAGLRAPVDRFFEDILVNAEDPALRENRLRLLAAIRTATRSVADFSAIGG